MKLVVVLSWLGSLVIAFFLGQNFSSQSNEGSTNKLLDVKQQTVNHSTSHETQDIPSKEKMLTIAEFVEPSVKSPKEIVALVTGLTGSQFSLNIAGTTEAYQHIESMTEDELLEALNFILSDKSGADYNQSIMMFLARYAELNPNAAMDFTLSNVTDKKQRLGAIIITLGSWAEQNPLDAYSWFKMNKADLADGVANMPLVSIFSGLAKDDLNSSINKLAELSSNSSDLTMAVMGIANTLSDPSEYQLLMERVQTMDDNRVLQSTLMAWSRAEPQDAAAWLETLDDQTQSDSLAERLLMSWARNEPAQAADWYMNYPNETSQQAKIEKVVQTIGYSSPEDALTWLNKQTNVDIAKPSKSLLRQAAFTNPEFSKANLHLIEDKKDKITVSYSIYRGLQRISQLKADDFLTQSPLKNELVQTINKSESRKKSKSKK